MEHLLVMHFEKKLEHSQHADIDTWIRENEENKKKYEDTIFIWENARDLRNNQNLNVALKWGKFANQLKTYNRKSEADDRL